MLIIYFFTFVFAILLLWICFTNLYNFIISMFGFGKQKPFPIAKRESKIAIFVPAHNEQEVISSTLRALNKVKYEKDNFDIYVLIDNCTDSTLSKVKRFKSVKFIERNDTANKGKPYAIANAISNIDNFYDKYELLLIVDADNIVEPNLLRAINNQYHFEGKPAMIQCYLDSKNSSGNVASGMAASYFYFNRFNQLAKYKLKFNNSILGTGFAINTNYLNEIGGFQASSLVEDLETEMITTLNCKRIVWNHQTRLFDEKPTSIKASVNQRKRWAQGYWSVAFKYGLKMLKLTFGLKARLSWRIRAFDSFLKLFSLGKGLQVLILGFGFCFSILMLVLDLHSIKYIDEFIELYFLTAFIFVGINVFNYFVMVIIAQSIDDPNYQYSFTKHMKTIFSFFILLMTFVYTQLFGLLKHKNQAEWVKTEHSITERED